MGLVVKSRGLVFDSQHLYDCLQLGKLQSWEQALLALEHQAPMWCTHTHMQNTRTHKVVKELK